ncbi:ankyrin repeat-containing domain protein [Coprinopsis sp. MPI-PUGE-AT-0042]|nr:ankyrin repeat-containing domain protein [Coprinopsis sp. MPI-PUGE-AT-0042]
MVQTFADFAISHDDDWRRHVRDAAGKPNSTYVFGNLILRIAIIDTKGGMSYASLTQKLGEILPQHIDFRNVVVFLDPPVEVRQRFSTGLIRASERGDVAAVALFLKLPGIDVNAADEKGVTALMVVSSGEVAKLLLAVPQVLVNAKDREGRTALMHAMGRKNAEVAKVLLEAPCINVHLADDRERTTLKYALESEILELVVLLLRVLGAQLDLTDTNERGMLIRMIQTKDSEAFAHLIGVSRPENHEADNLVHDRQSKQEGTLRGAPVKGGAVARYSFPTVSRGGNFRHEVHTRFAQTLQTPPSPNLDIQCDSWLSDNALQIEAAIQLLPAEEQPVARALAKGIYPRLSLLTLASISPLSQAQRAALEALEVQCETSCIADQLPYHQSVKETLRNLLNQRSKRLELRVAESVMSIDVQHLAIRMLQMLADPETRKRCLSVAQDGAKEQDLVDVLHALLGMETLEPFRPIFLRGLLQFSKTTGRFPRALIYNDVVVVESGTAITSGAFGDV